MMYYVGINIKETQRVMGYSSAKMVYNIYAHLNTERENTEEKINNYIDNLYNVFYRKNRFYRLSRQKKSKIIKP